MSLRMVVGDCEPPDARDQRRESVGQSAGESYATLLHAMEPGATVELAFPADADAPDPDADRLATFDAVILSGSPLHLYDATPESRRAVAWMRAVFASGTPAFGSCAGLQVAAVAAGGEVGPLGDRREMGFARRIWTTDAGRAHPLLDGRLPAFDALTLHGDEVTRLPDGATLLASNAAVPIQAAEIRHGAGIFWGVQYHPELSLHEIAAALRRDREAAITAGFVRDDAELEDHAGLLDALHRDPDRADLLWKLGVDPQVTDATRRRREIRNFIDRLVRPTHRRRRDSGAPHWLPNPSFAL